MGKQSDEKDGKRKVVYYFNSNVKTKKRSSNPKTT